MKQEAILKGPKQPNKAKRSTSPDPIDIHVGSRLRLRRNLLGMSQEQVGTACGLTFQQIQKYEHGTNRIGASRLYRFSQILDVPVSYFFNAMPEEAVTSDERRQGFGEKGQAPMEGIQNPDTELLHRRETLELIRAYYSITDKKSRRKIYELVKSMATIAE